MFRAFTLPDGTIVETRRSGKCGGPSSRSGQSFGFGTSYLYYRINGGEWHSCPPAIRNENKFAEWVACCNSVSDFLEAETA